MHIGLAPVQLTKPGLSYVMVIGIKRLSKTLNWKIIQNSIELNWERRSFISCVLYFSISIS